MLTEERLQRIVAITDEEGSVSVQRLATQLDISESTIRRDLLVLDKEHRINRVRGGAVSCNKHYKTIDETVMQRKSCNMEAKQVVGQYAASLIEENDFVYMDAGTTTEEMISFLDTKKNVTFVTNAIGHAKRLTQLGFTVYILGGAYKLETEAIVGEEAIASLEKYNFTKGFFGANGLNPVNGITTPDYREAVLKRKAMEHCKNKYVLCDKSKFAEISSVSFAEFKKVCIITDQVDNDKYQYHQYSNIIEVNRQ